MLCFPEYGILSSFRQKLEVAKSKMADLMTSMTPYNSFLVFSTEESKMALYSVIKRLLLFSTDHPCSTAPCLNGGTCSADSNSLGFKCSCSSGYIGLNCGIQQGNVMYQTRNTVLEHISKHREES